jgi:hypothetical protein
MSVITEQGLLGQYFCFVLEIEWGADEPPLDYRVQINEGEYLVVLFNRNVDPEEEGVRIIML